MAAVVESNSGPSAGTLTAAPVVGPLPPHAGQAESAESLQNKAKILNANAKAFTPTKPEVAIKGAGAALPSQLATTNAKNDARLKPAPTGGHPTSHHPPAPMFPPGGKGLPNSGSGILFPPGHMGPPGPHHSFPPGFGSPGGFPPGIPQPGPPGGLGFAPSPTNPMLYFPGMSPPLMMPPPTATMPGPMGPMPPHHGGPNRPPAGGNHPPSPPMVMPMGPHNGQWPPPPMAPPMPMQPPQMNPGMPVPLPYFSPAPGMMFPPPPPPLQPPTATKALGPTGLPAVPICSTKVSVGNASLAALNSKEPPKFSCVLLSGIPATGKTSLGRELVESLKQDGMGWEFFSGADVLGLSPTSLPSPSAEGANTNTSNGTELGKPTTPVGSGKRSSWDTTREVFDALGKRLDELLEQQKERRNLKGIVVDKNCKGIEDIFYLNALLQSKGVPFVGIVGMECNSDEVLFARMEGEEGEHKDKLKYHRVIHARIVALAKSMGMYRSVDSSRSRQDTLQALRTMVLGCCAQPPSRTLRPQHYSESHTNIMVDDYKEYCDVMTTLFECVSLGRTAQFPGFPSPIPFSKRDMTEKSRLQQMRGRCTVRRKVDGSRYLLLLHNGKLSLIPSHMRAVLRMPNSAWLGANLTTVGRFVLEGDLTHLTRDRQKEKFLVCDIHFWSDATGPEENLLARTTWTEQQEHLNKNLFSDSRATFAPGVDCVVAYHATQKLYKCVELLESDEYPCTGLIFQSNNPADRLLLWQPPSSISVDFRVGAQIGEIKRPETIPGSSSSMSLADAVAHGATMAITPSKLATTGSAFADLPTRTFVLEVYDKSEKKFVQYEGKATVDLRLPEVVEGSIISCTLADEVQHRWVFKRIRYDVLRPAYKSEVDELLDSCLVPRAKLVTWMVEEHIVYAEIPTTPDAKRGGPVTTSAAGIRAPPLNGANFLPSSTTAPSNHHTDPHAADPQAPSRTTTVDCQDGLGVNRVLNFAPSYSERLRKKTVEQPASNSNSSQLQQLRSIVPGLNVVSAAPEAPPKKAMETRSSVQAHSSHEPNRRCDGCRREKYREDLRFSRRDQLYYCYRCWSEMGWQFCARCGEFRSIPKLMGGKAVHDKHSEEALICRDCQREKNAATRVRSSNAPALSNNATAIEDDGAARRNNRQPRGKKAEVAKGESGGRRDHPTAPPPSKPEQRSGGRGQKVTPTPKLTEDTRVQPVVETPQATPQPTANAGVDVPDSEAALASEKKSGRCMSQ